MKIVARRAELLDALALCKGATATRTTKEVLRNVKASAYLDGGFTLMATDLEVGVSRTVAGVTVEATGDVVLPADRLLDILRASESLEVSIDLDGAVLVVRDEGSVYRMPTEAAREFPDIPATEGDPGWLMAAGALRSALGRVAVAVGKDNAKFAITGALFQPRPEAGRIELVATDTKRLVMDGVPIRADGDGPYSGACIAPTKGVSVFLRALADAPADADVRLVLRPNDASLTAGPATVYTRLLEGRYPPYRDIIPKKYYQTVRVPVGPYLSAARRAKITTTADAMAISLDFSRGRCLMRAEGERGASAVTVESDWDAEPFTIRLDPEYLIDSLKGCSADDVLDLGFSDAKGVRPAVFKRADGYTSVIMPLS